jgi:mercuric ion binding protein
METFMKNFLFAAALCGTLALPAMAQKAATKTADKAAASCCTAMAAKGKTAMSCPAGSKVACDDKVAVFNVSKMTCDGCANGLQAGIAKEKGVCDVKVDYKTKKATLHYNAKVTDVKKLEAAFGRKGFPAKVAPAKKS